MKEESSSFEEKMAGLKSPRVAVDQHMQSFRLPMLNTRKSALTGFILLILPFLFLSGVVLKHYLKVDFGLFTGVYEWIGDQDRLYGDHSVLNWIIRLALTVGPLAAVFINLASIMHVYVDKSSKEMLISFKLRWLNLSIILICLVIVSIFGIYLLAENL